MEGMKRNCKTQFNNQTLCNAPYYRVVVMGVVTYHNIHGREIRYCETCLNELAPMENPVPKADKQIVSVPPFYSEYADNACMRMRDMADI